MKFYICRYLNDDKKGHRNSTKAGTIHGNVMDENKKQISYS